MNRHPRLFASLVVGCVALVLLAGGLLYYVISRNDTARRALCLQRDDLNKQIAHDARALDRQVRFFRDHPHAFPGVPHSLIQAGIDDDNATLKARKKFRANLDILNC